MSAEKPKVAMQAAESALIAALLAAHDNTGPPVVPAIGQPLDATAIRRIQAAVCNARGPVAGFKCGRQIDEAVPIMAPILASRLYSNGATIPASHSRLRGVELEIGFRVIEPLPVLDGMIDRDAVKACVRVAVALEIVESRLLDHEQAPPSWKLADLQSNGGLVVSTASVTTWPTALQRAGVRLEVNGRILHDRVAEVPGGDAFDTFVAFARHVGEHCGGLQPGQTVITGSLTGVDYLQPGDVVKGSIDALGDVNVRFE